MLFARLPSPWDVAVGWRSCSLIGLMQLVDAHRTVNVNQLHERHPTASDIPWVTVF
jgi:hypothetical protein